MFITVLKQKLGPSHVDPDMFLALTLAIVMYMKPTQHWFNNIARLV